MEGAIDTSCGDERLRRDELRGRKEVKKGSHQTSIARRKMSDSRKAIWANPAFRERMRLVMRAAYTGNGRTKKRTVKERSKRIELFRAAADIESGAIRLEKIGLKQDSKAMLAAVVSLRMYAAKIL